MNDLGVGSEHQYGDAAKGQDAFVVIAPLTKAQRVGDVGQVIKPNPNPKPKPNPGAAGGRRWPGCWRVGIVPVLVRNLL